MDFYFFNGEPKAMPMPLKSSDSLVLYEVLRVINGIPIFFDDHYVRLVDSFRQTVVGFIPDYDNLIIRLSKCIANIRENDFNIWIEYVVNGRTIDEFLWPIAGNYPSIETYKSGVKVGVLAAERQNPNAKVLNASLKSEALSLMKENDWFEVALLNHANEVTEGHRSNLCFIDGNIIYTAPKYMVLEGITLLKTLEIAQQNGFVIARKALTLCEIEIMEEIFLTGTSVITSYSIHYTKLYESGG